MCAVQQHFAVIISAMSSAKNIATIERFYDAFARHDAEGMIACYADNVVFKDPAFGELQADDARGMWRMLCKFGKDLSVESSDVKATLTAGSAHWSAQYTFGPLKRQINNEVEATFTFDNGMITSHVDDFSFYTWSRQAFGPVGLAIGWIPITPLVMRKAVRRQLAGFIAHNEAKTS